MKKRIGYILMLIIAIVGCRLLYGINYGLNSTAYYQDNLYRYDILNNQELLDMRIDGRYIYYVLKDYKKYSFIKYDITNNKYEKEYIFNNPDELQEIKIIQDDNYFYLTSFNNNLYLKFDSQLELIEEKRNITNKDNKYGLFKEKLVTVSKNKIYYQDKLYSEVDLACGNIQEILYENNVYLRFYDKTNNMGCLYNLNKKETYYLDYDRVLIANNKYLEYQLSNLKFRYDREDYYLNNIRESSYLTIRDNGDYLLSYDENKNSLKIYNLDTRKIIYKIEVPTFKNSQLSHFCIDNYVYFVEKNNTGRYIYVWEYLKTPRNNENMVEYNEREYKFNNNNLLREIKAKYGVDIYLYDNSVIYLKDYYLLPSYDDILINERLKNIKNILDKSSIDRQEAVIQSHLKIYFNKRIIHNGKNEYIEVYYSNNDKNNFVALDILNNNFNSVVLDVIDNILESSKPEIKD